MKRLVFFIILIISLFTIKNLLISIYTLWQKQELVVRAQKQLDMERKRNDELKKQLSRAQSPQFLEEEARNKLFLIKPNEQQIIIPKDLLQASSSGKGKQASVPIWREWFDLFL